MTAINDVFQIPERVHDGDFVLKLTDGVTRSEDTISDYVVTPQLALSFDDAIALIRSSVESGSSKGAFLHGSFGSGKSHFMAILTLLLERNRSALRKEGLEAVVSASNQWQRDRKLMVVPYHMIGAKSFESAVLGGYAKFVRQRYPKAPTPGFYRADGVFQSATTIRAHMDDDAKFFASLNKGASDTDGWGSIGAGWDADSFDHAMTAEPGAEDRLRLIGDVIDAYIPAMRGQGADGEETYASIDEGLSALAQHAQSLGYAGVILFLDELILWLAGHSGDPGFVQRESQKLVKLVEGQNADRPIPIVSFIARQRDLRELVGEHMPGSEQLNFNDIFSWFEARFKTITLEDRNLPLIAEKRLLRPKSAKAKDQIDVAFERTSKTRKEVFDTLLTRNADREQFRQIYPFTPALMQTLVAVSSLLQRERTALKLMQQLLVDHRHTLALGDVLPVGDLYDVIDTRDEPFSQAMKRRFAHAQELYARKLLPVLEAEHGVTRAEIDEGTVDDPDLMQRFRNDDRLIKTLLLSALAENVEVLRNLDAARLAALNHGTVNSPIPGRESAMVLSKVQKWAAEVGEIKVSEDRTNPTISLQIVGIDTDSILENAQRADNIGNRIKLVRRMLFDALGLQDEHDLDGIRYELEWRGTRRNCEILYDNVRTLSADAFNPSGDGWRVVIDYPFDPDTNSPMDDVTRVDEIRRSGASIDALVWLPAFLKPRALDELGKLVRLEDALVGQRFDEYASHLSQTDRDVAKQILRNQRDQLRSRVRNYLLTAYGIRQVDKSGIDDSHDIGDHFLTLNAGFSLQNPNQADFKPALDHLIDQAFAHRHPKHPQFPIEMKRAVLNRALDVIRQACQEPGGRLEVDLRLRAEVRAVVEPLKLADLKETHLVLRDDVKDELTRRIDADVSGAITVGQLRRWFDDGGQRGLPTNIENLVIIAFALQTGRGFYLHGGVVDARLEALDDRTELREQAIPAEGTWDAAIVRTNLLFGLEPPKLRNAQNAASLAMLLQNEATKFEGSVRTLGDTLSKRLEILDVNTSKSNRLRTVKATVALLGDLRAVEASEVILVMANATIATSETAMGLVIKGAVGMHQQLSTLDWQMLDRLRALGGASLTRVDALTDKVIEALCEDEHIIALSDTFPEVRCEAVDLLFEVAKSNAPTVREASPPAARPEASAGETESTQEDAPMAGAPLGPYGRTRVPVNGLTSLARQLQAEFAQDSDAVVEVTWTVTIRS